MMTQQMDRQRLLRTSSSVGHGEPSTHAAITINGNGIITGCSDGADALLGWALADIVGRSHDCLFMPEECERGLPDAKLAAVRLHDFSHETCWCCRQDGSRFWASSIMLSRMTGDGHGFVRILQDLTGRDATARALLLSEAQFRLLTETIPQLVWRSLDDGQWDWAGPQWVAYTGQPEAESHQRGWLAMVHPEDQPTTIQAWNDALARGGLDVEHRVRRADGIYRWFQTRAVPLEDVEDATAPRHWFGTSTDIHAMREAEQRIQFLAFHDPLTGAANRTLLQQVLDRVTSPDPASSDGRTRCNLLFLDLDRFKQINDRFGHSGGDELLRQVADRLRACLADPGTVARTGGDEFVLVQPDACPEDAATLGAAVAKALSRGFVIHEQALQIGVSIGVACWPRDGSVPDELLRHADLALHHSKAASETLQFYAPAMEIAVRQRQALEHDLLQAVERCELDVHYQPIFAAGSLSGFEALARWTHGERGTVPPDIFIPLAEECGLIVRLGAWVLERACRTAVSWPAGVFIAVNLSPAQFRAGDLAQQIATVLTRTGLAADRLELEVTEGLLMKNSEQVLGTLAAIRSLGVRIALDDFGTGYSSLSYLCRFPFSKLKIDRSFVRDIETDAGACTVVKAVTSLGHSLGLEVAAEGVETEAQLAMLREIGCDHMQGFLLGRPAAAPGSLPA